MDRSPSSTNLHHKLIIEGNTSGELPSFRTQNNKLPIKGGIASQVIRHPTYSPHIHLQPIRSKPLQTHPPNSHQKPLNPVKSTKKANPPFQLPIPPSIPPQTLLHKIPNPPPYRPVRIRQKINTNYNYNLHAVTSHWCPCGSCCGLQR